MQDLEALRVEILASFEDAADLATLDVARVAALGKKGVLTERMKGLGSLEPEARKSAGQALNRVKVELFEALDARRAALEGGALGSRLDSEKIDITLPEVGVPTNFPRFSDLIAWQNISPLLEVF